jgi:hypothetical protein
LNSNEQFYLWNELFYAETELGALTSEAWGNTSIGVDAVWNNYYLALANIHDIYDRLDEMCETAEDIEIDDKVRAQLTVVEAFKTFKITDMFGDIPYSEAGYIWFNTTENRKPKYDGQDTIYKTFVEKEKVVREGVQVDTLADGTKIYLDGDVYYSVNDDGSYTRYNYYRSIKESLALSIEICDNVKTLAFAMTDVESVGDFKGDVQKRIDRNNKVVEKEEEEEIVEETVSRYSTENIVVVTYGDGNVAYKSVVLNYNNYTVKVVYDTTDDGVDNGIEYTIPAYEFVVIER